MYHIGICDDGENICSSLETMLLQCAKENRLSLDVNIWNTGEGLRDYLEAGQRLDILFLDIELFQMTGMEVGDYIRNCLNDREMQIVYISGKASYARELFKTQPMDFLVKPISQKQINETVELAVKLIQKKSEKFEFQHGKDYYYIPVGEIMYLESMGRKIRLVTPTENYEYYGKLKEIATRLPEQFLMIHQSYIVNKDFIFRYTYEMVELTEGTRLNISPAKRKQVREQLLREE